MSYQIDQSIKIEDTKKTSYVCLANGSSIVSSISAKDKRFLKSFFHELDKPLIFKIFTFSVLCARNILLLNAGFIAIDREYIGHERQIKSFILQVLQIEYFQEPVIDFILVGKHSSAHKGAYYALKNNTSDIKITAREVLNYYEKINKS